MYLHTLKTLECYVALQLAVQPAARKKHLGQLETGKPPSRGARCEGSRWVVHTLSSYHYVIAIVFFFFFAPFSYRVTLAALFVPHPSTMRH